MKTFVIRRTMKMYQDVFVSANNLNEAMAKVRSGEGLEPHNYGDLQQAGQVALQRQKILEDLND